MNSENTGLRSGDYVGITQIDADDTYATWFDFRSGSSANIIGAKVNPPPGTPINFYITGSEGQHPILHWNSNSEIDLAGYKIYQSTNGSTFTLYHTINSASTNSFTDNGVTIGDGTDPWIWYKITAFDDGSQESTQTDAERVKLGGINKETTTQLEATDNLHYMLHKAYPNPFNPTTLINYTVASDGLVNMKVYNSSGQLVAKLIDQYQTKGKYSVSFDGSNLASGIYICDFTVNDFHDSVKLILSK